MGNWTLESDQRQQEFAVLMERRRVNRTPQNSFYQKPKVYRGYNVERCVFTRVESCAGSEGDKP